MGGERLRVASAIAAAAFLCTSATAWAVGFDDPASNDPGQQLDGGVPLVAYDNVQREDTPDDPDYDRAEPDLPDADPSTNVFSERFDLFGFASSRTRTNARYLDPTGPNFLNGMVSGFNAAGAWKITRGDPSVSVAILDTGINWDNGGLRTQVRLNADELPQPQPTDNGADLNGYDLNDNGVLDVDDYKDDPRVNKPAPDGAGPDQGHGLLERAGQRRQRLRRRHRRLGLLRRRQRPAGHVELLRRREPRHGTRGGGGRARQRRPGLDRRLPEVPVRAAAGLGHVRVRPEQLLPGGHLRRRQRREGDRGRGRRPVPLLVRGEGIALRLRARRGAALLRRRPEHRQPQLPGRVQPRDADPGRGRRRRGPRRGAA